MKFPFAILILTTLLSCDKNEADVPNNKDGIEGTGAFLFDVETQLTNSINVYYHVPESEVETMPVLILLHGNTRNAREIRNAWIAESNAKGFMIVAPEFSDENFPGGDAYILGNVFLDGDNPSPETLNPEQDWAFSVIEPLFDEIRNRTSNLSSNYNIFGFSAGAQFAHRFIMLKPNARFDKIIASASGWYTLPDTSIVFPYGIDESPIEEVLPSAYFSANFTIQIGILDNNPDAPALRRNAIVDQQGDNRYDRAFHMFNTSKTIAEDLSISFDWNIIKTEGNDHNLEGSITQASDILY